MINPKLFNPDYLLHLCQKHGLRPSKKYGQNYLINSEVIERIIEVAELDKKDTVVEVGPGFGVLTLALAKRVGHVVAFEIEKKLQPYWDSILSSRSTPSEALRPSRTVGGELPRLGRGPLLEMIEPEGNIEIVWGNVLKEFTTIDQQRSFPFDSSRDSLRVRMTGDVRTTEQFRMTGDVSVAENAREADGVRMTEKVSVADGARMTDGYKVVANLPYQITSPVLRLFLESDSPPATMVLMVQKEVAERICAKPTSRAEDGRSRPGDMSLLAVSVQYYADPEYLFTVPRTDFWPVPRVDSAVIKIKNIRSGEKAVVKKQTARSERPSQASGPARGDTVWPARDDDFDKKFFAIVKAGFAQRRKLLIKNLEPVVGKERREVLKQAFASLGLSPTARAQELSVEQWVELVCALSFLTDRDPSSAARPHSG